MLRRGLAAWKGVLEPMRRTVYSPLRSGGRGSDGPEVFVEAKAFPSDWEKKGRVEAMSGELDHPGPRLRKGIEGARLQAH